MVVRKIVVSGLKFAAVDLDLLKTFVKFMFLFFLKQFLKSYHNIRDEMTAELFYNCYYILTCHLS